MPPAADQENPADAEPPNDRAKTGLVCRGPQKSARNRWVPYSPCSVTLKGSHPFQGNVDILWLKIVGRVHKNPSKIAPPPLNSELITTFPPIVRLRSLHSIQSSSQGKSYCCCSLTHVALSPPVQKTTRQEKRRYRSNLLRFSAKI